jgi:hypothetical protein
MNVFGVPSVVIPFIPNFVNIGSLVQKFKKKRHTHTQHGDLINLLFPFKDGKWAINSIMSNFEKCH